MTDGWDLPGYDVQELLGFGGTGEVWRARELATGDAVVLKRLALEVDPAVLAAVRTLDTPYAVRLRDVIGDVLVLDLAGGGSLAALLARRGRLDPGEVVTIAAPIAQALAAAHRRGLVHGGLTPSSVLFTTDGMPLLSDLGLACSAAGAQADAAEDVRALAVLCRAALGDAPRALAAVVARGLEADPAARPDAAGFAALLRQSHAVAPVRMDGQLPPPAEPATRWRPVLVAVVLVVAAATGGWLSGRSGPAGPAPLSPVVASPPRVAAPDWPAVLHRLDAARAAAFAAADAGRLRAVYAAGSAGLAADSASVRRLRAAGQTARGVRHRVREVVQLAYDGRTARLRVADVLAGYEVVAADGSVTARAEPRPEASYVVELVREPAGWRLTVVRALRAAPTPGQGA